MDLREAGRSAETNLCDISVQCTARASLVATVPSFKARAELGGLNKDRKVKVCSKLIHDTFQSKFVEINLRFHKKSYLVFKDDFFEHELYVLLVS